MVDGLCKTISDYPSGNGAMPLFYSLRDCVPGVFDAMLFAIFLIIFAGNYFLIKNRTGRAKILVALLASSFIMVPMSLLLALAQLITFKSALLYGFLVIVTFVSFVVSDNS